VFDGFVKFPPRIFVKNSRTNEVIAITSPVNEIINSVVSVMTDHVIEKVFMIKVKLKKRKTKVRANTVDSDSFGITITSILLQCP
jgi:hypothetical protein